MQRGPPNRFLWVVVRCAFSSGQRSWHTQFPSSLRLHYRRHVLLFFLSSLSCNHKLCLASHRAGLWSLHHFPAACLVSHRAACLPFLLLVLTPSVLHPHHGCPHSHMFHPLLQLLLILVCETLGYTTNSSYSYRIEFAPRLFPGTISRVIILHMCKSWRHIRMGQQL